MVGDLAQRDTALFAQAFYLLAEIALGVQGSAMLGPGYLQVKRLRETMDGRRHIA